MVQYGLMESFLERNLPPYLAHDLDAWKKGVEEKSHLQRQFYKTYLAARYEAMFGKEM